MGKGDTQHYAPLPAQRQSFPTGLHTSAQISPREDTERQGCRQRSTAFGHATVLLQPLQSPRAEQGILLRGLPCSAHHLITSIVSVPGLGDWPGLLHNFACPGPLSPGFHAMIRQPVVQNLKLCPCIQHHKQEILPGPVPSSLPLLGRTRDRKSAPPPQRSSPPRTCHTRRAACAGRAALTRLHSRLHASTHARACTPRACGNGPLRSEPASGLRRRSLGSPSRLPPLLFPRQ